MLTAVITFWGVLAVQCVCLILLFSLRLQDARFMFLIGFVEPLLGTPPAVFAFCYLRNEMTKNQSRLLEINGDLQRTLMNVKELGRMLPMCASCKKVRTDQGYWNRMEDYITKHSNAEFTHGVCPACLKKQSGEMRRNNKRNGQE